MRKNKMTGRAMSLPMGAFLGAAYAFGWTLLMATLLAWLVHKEVLKEEMVGYGSMIVLLSSAMLGTWMGYHRVRRQKLLTGLSVGGLYYLMLLSMTSLFFGGQYAGMGVTALLVTGGCGTAVLMEMEREKRTGRGRKIRL